MSSRLRTVAVVLAGGTGSRVGLDIPKQLLKVAGKTILEHTLDVFQDAPEIDEIIVLMTTGATSADARPPGRAGYSKVSQVSRAAAAPATRPRTPDRARARSATTTARCSSTTPYGRCWTHRIITRVRGRTRPVRRGRRRHPVRRHDHRRSTSDDVITDVPDRSRTAPRPDPAGVPALHDPPRPTTLAGQDPDFTATDDCGVVLRYLPDVPIWRGPRLGAEHEGHPPDRRLPGRQAVPARPRTAPRPADPDALPARRSPARRVVVFGGSYGIGADIAELATGSAAPTSTRSAAPRPAPTSSGREDVEAALRTAFEATGRIDYVVVTAGVLRRGALVDDRSRRSRRRIRGQLPRARCSSPRPPCPTCSRPRASCCCSPPAPTPAAGPATASTPRPRPPWSTSPRPSPTSGRDVRRARQLRQPRAHRHPDAHQGVRRGARGLAAVVRGGGAGVASTC